MKRTELAEYSAYIITEYYKNNISFFLDALSEKVLWIGPAQGQIIRTKRALLDAFSKENTSLTFAVQNMQVIPVPINATCLDVILTLAITTFYPNGEKTVFQQRGELLWAEERFKDADGKWTKDYFIRVCHISNEYPYDMRDTIYPDHFTELDIAKLFSGGVQMPSYPLRGVNNAFFYLSGEAIIWLSTKGIHTLVHTADKVYESTELIASVVEKYSETLVRVHASFAINPMYVSEIGRFYVQMKDGTKIRIPEKKYTKTRDLITQRIAGVKST